MTIAATLKSTRAGQEFKTLPSISSHPSCTPQNENVSMPRRFEFQWHRQLRESSQRGPNSAELTKLASSELASRVLSASQARTGEGMTKWENSSLWDTLLQRLETLEKDSRALYRPGYSWKAEDLRFEEMILMMSSWGSESRPVQQM